MKTRYLKIALFVLITMAFVAGALPQKAVAAQCVDYYTVREGDTTPKISQTYGLKWREIADPNGLPRYWKPVEGTELCIPPGGDTSSSSSTTTTSSSTTSSTTLSSGTSVPGYTNAIFTAGVVGNKVTVNGSNFPKKASFFVKVRDGNARIGGWEKLGTFNIPKKTNKQQTYTLPKDLKGSIYIDVCLKNASTDELVCRKVLHLY